MALVYKDRVLETSTTTGTGAFTLAGTLPSFQTFAAIGDGNTCYYTITGGSQWEVGLGTYTASGTSLSRDVVLDSSNSGSLVDFAAGTKTVFVTLPADVANTTPKTYPSAGIAVSTGSAWGTSKTTPTGDVVGTTDTQSLTNKTISLSGLLTQSAGADIASASTVDLTAATGNCPKITGTTAVEAWTMNTGQQMKCIADGALPLTFHATTNNIAGGGNYTCEAGDIINLVKGLDGVVRVFVMSSMIPAGAELNFHGVNAPPGWLLMYGQVVNIADYPRLFSVLGTRYGGDGTTTFGIPDSRGRVTIGKDDMGGTAANRVTTGGAGFNGKTLGAVGGGETLTLTISQIPNHEHTVGASQLGASGTARYVVGSSANSFNTTSAGGGGSHRTVQPSIVANKIIKT